MSPVRRPATDEPARPARRKRRAAEVRPAPARRVTGIGVIGLGFMGRTHIAAWAAADAAGLRNRLVAVCDPDPARRAGHAPSGGNLGPGVRGGRIFDPRAVAGCERPEDLLARDDVDVVSICTWTDTHVDLALAALAAGKHVLVEKPVALRERPAARLAAAARAAPTLCLPAMCMRFWPGWNWLHAAVADGRYGAVRSATFRRLGSRPGWASTFYADPQRSGGALFDLHVHDADFVRWLFGAPRAVSTAGTPEHLSTLYRFERGPAHVTAEAGWDHDPGLPFRMAYTLVFERATADYDSTRDPPLRVFRDGLEQPVEVLPGTGYDGQARHLLAAIAHGARSSGLLATCDEAVGVTAMLVAEERSLRGGVVVEM